MAKEIRDIEEQVDHKISVDSLTDEAAKVELKPKSGCLTAGILDMVRQYLKPELDRIKERLALLEKQ